MDYLSIIKQPISSELADFIALFNQSMTHEDGLLGQALAHIRQRGGKRMRPMLILLMAKNFGTITSKTQHAAVGLELLHTASLVHDDVVDESQERRGQSSLNAEYDNKVAVLVGDYLLSTALLNVSFTNDDVIVRALAKLGQTLADGELLQLSNIQQDDLSEEVYFQVINQKTAALFEACAGIGAQSAGAPKAEVDAAKLFGQQLGIIFQIRDDIFDYYDNDAIGKPTGNDMAEGKLTLPAIYALNVTGDESMREIALKVKHNAVSQEEIEQLVAFTKQHGGIAYAEQRMQQLHDQAMQFVERYGTSDDVKTSLKAYLDFVIAREL